MASPNYQLRLGNSRALFEAAFPLDGCSTLAEWIKRTCRLRAIELLGEEKARELLNGEEI